MQRLRPHGPGIDLDGDKSIHQTGNGKHMMKPVIGVVSVQ
jgi:hypothetical protein